MRTTPLALAVAALLAIGPVFAIPAGAVVPADALAAPVLVSPLPYSASAANPIFAWKSVPGAVSYSVRVFASPTMSGSLACGGESTSLRLGCGELAPGPYWWTVKAIGVDNVEGPYAAAQTFTKRPRVLLAPKLTSPPTGSVFRFPDQMGVMRWTSVPDAATYQVQVSTDPSFPDPPLDPRQYPGVGSEAELIPDSEFGRVQYWRVRAVTDAGADVSPWSGVRSFKVVWPDAPTLTSPEAGATVSDLHLVWEPVIGATLYELQVADPGDPSFLGATQVDSIFDTFIGYAPTGLSTFLWRVRARSGGGHSAWSESRLVTVDAGAPPAPEPGPVAPLARVTLTSPRDGATGVDLAATPIDWDVVASARFYDVQVIPAGDPWYEPLLSDFPIHVPPRVGPLDAGRTYKWRVRANASNGLFNAGPWSEEWTFSTPPASAIALLAPSPGAVVPGETLAFSWTSLKSAPVAYVETSRDPAFADSQRSRAYADGRVDMRGVLEPGVWYWRVVAGRGGAISSIAARSATRSLTVLDTAPPAGRNLAGVSCSTQDSIDLYATATDASGAVTKIGASADGLAWRELPYLQPAPWDLTQAPYPGHTPGPRPVWMRWQDDAGNWSTPTLAVVALGCPAEADVDLPSASGARAVGIVPGSVITSSGRVGVRTSWSGTDPTTYVLSYDLTVRPTDDRVSAPTFSDVELPTKDMWLPPHVLYRIETRATDAARNVGRTSVGPPFQVRRYSEANRAITYHGAWKSVSKPEYWLGRARASSSRGSKATIRISARSIALVARRGPSRGAATILVNGIKVATIDLYASKKQFRQVVWSRDWSTSALRTVTVRVAGTEGRPWVDIDAFAVIP